MFPMIQNILRFMAKATTPVALTINCGDKNKNILFNKINYHDSYIIKYYFISYQILCTGISTSPFCETKLIN